MRPVPKTRLRRKAKWIGRYGRRALLACAWLTSALAFAAGRPDISAPVQSESVASAQESRLNRPPGSILFVPLDGNICRHALIDNTTWRIIDDGVLNCAGPLSLAQKEGNRQWLAGRMKSLQQSFAKE